MQAPAVAAARRLADEVLFPAAASVDDAGTVPPALFEALAEAGFYALGAPREVAAALGVDLPDDDARGRVAEAFAGGCLAAAFVWLQHRGALRAVAGTAETALREAFLAPMAAGRVRGGLAITSATRTGPPAVRATATGAGWRFDGQAPWVTGWGLVDVLLMAARDEDDRLVWALVDAVDSAALRATPLRLLAVQASGTVTLGVHALTVPRERVVLVEPHAAYLARDVDALMFNGFLATGVADRAIRLMDGDGHALAAELDAVRARLRTADADSAPAARAAASELALRAASALAVHTGARSVLAGSHADRLVREATFLLTFGSRPAIRAALLERLGAAPDARPGSDPAGGVRG